MKVLVTGGCGFVGSAICRGLVAHSPDFNVTSLDNFRRVGAETNRDPLLRLGISVVHGDVRLESDFEALGPFDWVIDAAAEPSVLAGAAPGTGTSSRQLVEHNLIGTVHLLEAAARWRAGVVLLSTSRVYSIPALATLPLKESEEERGPCFTVNASEPLPAGVSPEGITEDFSTAAPVSLYGATKLASETLALEYAHRHGTPLFVNRCGVMAGAGQFGRADQGIFSWWIREWIAKRPLAYIGFGGRGLQVRDCLHPDDLMALVLLQMQAGQDSAPAVYNVSGGAASATSLAQLSRWCANQYGPQAIGATSQSRNYDLAWVVLDSGRVTERFGWRPNRSAPSIFAEIAGLPTP
jgi:CDP-paratose 2-epimerase